VSQAGVPASRKKFVQNVENPDRAAVGVSYKDAQDFAQWTGKRLPSESEWQVAAYWNGTVLQRFAWGDDWNWENVRPPPADSSGAPPIVQELSNDRSFTGAIGMSGGVREWAVATDPGSGPSVMGYYSCQFVSDPSRARTVFDTHQSDYDSKHAIERKNSGAADPKIGFRFALSLVRK
jgi:formylglycine-generating enzyme required for sulfatase activity